MAVMVLCQVQLDAYPDRCFQILHRLRLRTNIFGSATVTKQSPLIRVLTLRYLLLGLLYDFIDICTVTRNTHFQIARTPETSESWPCHLSASNYIIRDKGPSSVIAYVAFIFCLRVAPLIPCGVGMGSITHPSLYLMH